MNWRIALPAVAVLLALAAAARPAINRQQLMTDALIVLDITRSMNTRDMDGRARLDFARDALLDWIASRPCGSRIGLAIFTERRSLTLFEPVEICADYSSIVNAMNGLDWRMAWEGDSMVQKGLDHALDRALDFGVPLLFVTDGHEAPPLPYAGPGQFGGESPGGVILGVGGEIPAQIPKFDDLGRETGFYEADDVQHSPSRIGAPPPDASERPGFHPRNNPYGESDLEGSEHLSALRDDYLTQLASGRDLGFLRLAEGPAQIDRALVEHAPPRLATVSRSLSPILASAALILLLVLWGAGRNFLLTTKEEQTP